MISLESFGNKLIQIIPTKRNDLYLVAVSGGADSMTLLFLLNLLLPGQVIATHCNYKLRGEESDKDENLVTSFCKKHKIKLHKIKFDTIKAKATQKTGMQETARNLRYTYFENLVKENKYSYLFTAHHANDNAETILLNITRGSGINGLKGISPISNNLVRPLLDYTKEEILEFASKNKIPYREDASNLKNDYNRNRVRNIIIPELIKINSSFVEHINELSEIAKSANAILSQTINSFLHEKCVSNSDGLVIPISELLKVSSPYYYLCEILIPFGFNNIQTQNIFNKLNTPSDKIFYSEKHRLIVGKSTITIDLGAPLSKQISVRQLPFNLDTKTYSIDIQYISLKKDSEIIFKKGIFILDAKKLNIENLVLSSWERGEKFTPFGMKHQKKISDFFIDKKISKVEKENTLVFKSDNKIIAVLPYEIDNNYSVTKDTKKIIQIAIKQKAPN